MGLKVRGVGLKVRSRAVDVEVLEEGYVYSILNFGALHVRGCMSESAHKLLAEVGKSESLPPRLKTICSRQENKTGG